MILEDSAMIMETTKVQLYYEKYGKGKELILLHGNGEDHKIFKKAITILKQHFTVYAIDTRGHGQSSSVTSLHYQDMADDIYDFICSNHLDKPIVYGFSDGGIVALLLAIQYPSLLSNIIVSGVNTSPNGLKRRWLYLYKIIYFVTRSKTMKVMLQEPCITKEQLQQIIIPVTITAGSKDMIKVSHIQNIADTIKQSTVKILVGQTHASYVVDSEEIATIIMEACLIK